MKRIFALLYVIILSLPLLAQNKGDINWETDIDYLAKELPSRHINLFAQYDQNDFTADIEIIKAMSNFKGDLHVAIALQQLIAKLGDSHTMLNFAGLLDRSRILPLHLLWTSDGLHVLHTTMENYALLGRRIDAINKIPISKIVESLSTLFTIDNEAVVKSFIPRYIPIIQLLEYFNIANGDRVELTLDGCETYSLAAAPMGKGNSVSFSPKAVSFAIKNENTFFVENYFADEKIYYILYNRCWSRELEMQHGDPSKADAMPSFEMLEDNIFTTLENRSVDKLIFDMRFNGGGHSGQGTKFIDKLAIFLKKHPQISTYVVIGRWTFSSAILNAMDFKRQTNAIFVGEPTAGKPNHFGEVRSFQLPTSGLHVQYSTEYFQMSDDNVNTITPDIEIEMSFDDFTEGIDPVYEWIKRQTPAEHPDNKAL